MSDITDPELCSLITNVNHPNFLSSQKLTILSLFGLKSFYGFVILGGKMEPIVSLVFYFAIKKWKSVTKKHIEHRR